MIYKVFEAVHKNKRVKIKEEYRVSRINMGILFLVRFLGVVTVYIVYF